MRSSKLLALFWLSVSHGARTKPKTTLIQSETFQDPTVDSQKFPKAGASTKELTAAAQQSDGLFPGAHALIEENSVGRHDYHEGGSDNSKRVRRRCCCRKGTCSSNEIENGLQAKRNRSHAMICCKFHKKSCPVNSWFYTWEEFADEMCESQEELEIERAISLAVGVGSGSNSTALCQSQLRAFTKQIKLQLKEHQREFFHGTAIDRIHLSKAATEIAHQMIVPGKQQFDRSSIGARFFTHRQQMTMLWNQIEAADRTPWKHHLGAAELSRGDDVAFARVVEHEDVNQIRACSTATTANIWYIASATFAGVAPEKPVVLMIGKDDKEALETTQFWKGELQGVAENPPEYGLFVMSIGKFGCDSLVPLLKGAIEAQISDGTKGEHLKRKWSRILLFSCGTGSAKMPIDLIGDAYPRPFSDESTEVATIDETTLKNINNLRAALAAFKHLSFESLASACPYAAEESLGWVSLSTEAGDEEIRLLLKSCPNLARIDLSATKVTDVGLHWIAQHCKRLVSVNIDEAKATLVTASGVHFLLEKCPQIYQKDLEELAMNLRDEEIESLVSLTA